MIKVIEIDLEDLFKDAIDPEEAEEEKVVCPALELLGLYEQREALRIDRDAMSTFVLPCEPEWETKTMLDTAILRLTEQIRHYGEIPA